MTDRQKALAAILAVVPALLLACTAWVSAKAKQEEAKAAWAGYGEYVTDQLRRDEAILKALNDCETLLRLRPALYNAYTMGAEIATSAPPEGSNWGTLPVPAATPQPQAQVVLDELARSRGWEPGGTKQ